MRAFGCADEFIEFHLDGLGVPILRILNQEDHQKRDDHRAGVNDQLPSVTEAEYWPSNHP